MTHIQGNFEGSALERWEQSHGIIRKVVNGCEYVALDDRQKFDAACNADRQTHFREMMMRASEEI